MAEAYRREIARRTRRGLEGRARAKKSTGGKTYGYNGADIDPEQAAVVRKYSSASRLAKRREQSRAT